MASEYVDPWPLHGLILRTPRLELRPDDDAGLRELAAEAVRGVHPPEEMPFEVPWTDAPADRLGGDVLRFHWSQRASFRAEDWVVNFLVRPRTTTSRAAGGQDGGDDVGPVIGNQGLHARDFAVLGTVDTGSWLGRRHQGQGLGTEMRAAVLMFAFDHLDARLARSAAFAENRRSLGVSRRLGYLPDGTAEIARRGGSGVEQRLVLTRERFTEHRPAWTLSVSGTAPCRAMFGLPSGA